MMYKAVTGVLLLAFLHLSWARTLSQVKCSSDEFLCNVSMTCVPEDWRCDNYQDCANGEDELSCGLTTRCEYEDDFQCGTGECIPADWRCDVDPDCTDGSDEGNFCDYYARQRDDSDDVEQIHSHILRSIQRQAAQKR